MCSVVVLGTGEIECNLRNYEPYKEYFDRIKRWAEHVACMGDRRGAYRVVQGKSKVKTPLERPRRRWENNIKKDLQNVGWEEWTRYVSG